MYYSSDFLGFDKAPNTRVAKYREEIYQGLYPSEFSNEKTDEESSAGLVLPWTYCPAPDDPVTCLHLVEELMHLIIVLITVRWTPVSVAVMTSFVLTLLPSILGNAVAGPKQ
jgi:hypothetical protein